YISPLKALGVDVERNLRAPLAGVRAVAQREGVPFHEPQVGVRSGDTPAAERTRLNRQPPEILITTPESLYLILTSRSRDILRDVDTVIVDEIHSLVATKRGTHLFLSLERLERLRREDDPQRRPLQRIGLSATQRPLDEVARLLGGAEADANPEQPVRPRPVEIVEAGRSKQIAVTIEVPVEDMTQLAQPVVTGSAAGAPQPASIWPAIHPRLVELIRGHRSTMIFVNSRRLAERLAAAINELAEEELALAHHGSIAKDTRLVIEDRLKLGQLPAIVATSSMELGIDMGAVDLVVQIEAPPSIASGLQRIGRAGHQVGAVSSGIVFPKYRGDLLACAAASRRMIDGEVEETFYPRNPLDVLAQQIVAIVALGRVSVAELFATARSAAPYHELPYSAFESVLDMLAGRYPSDDFAELRPRVNWDRIAGEVAPLKGSQRIAVLNAGTIPDRGLYGVFLADGEGPGNRVGELDEEMVFETHVGEIFLLGASSWRVVDITTDRVLVVPAPGEPGRMPFWRGDGPGRPVEFGRAIGELTRTLRRLPRDDASHRLTTQHGLDRLAAVNLLNYVHDQLEAVGETPTDDTVVVESFLDEVGDWRIAVMTPFGARVHAPWAMAVAARLREAYPTEVDMMWTDDGMVFRLPESDQPPPAEMFFPAADEIEDRVVRELGSTSLFAARFRENAARALLLPRRRPDRRTPLWMQRRRAADLLAVAAEYDSFPIMLESYRECLRDVFDLKGLKSILRDVEQHKLRVHAVESKTPSPFAGSLMFNYTANFLYEGDAPLAERRAAALSLDHAQLRELLGDSELRELLDAEAVDEVARELQRLDERFWMRDVDDLHVALRHLGDLSREELASRCAPDAAASGELDAWLASLVNGRRAILVRMAGEPRYVAAEDASRLRDALGIVPPMGLPHAFLESVDDPLGDLVSRYARTHVPFHAEDVAARLGLGVAPIRSALEQLASRGRVVSGQFLPGGRGVEWCSAEVLRTLKRRSLARLRKQVESVSPDALGRFLPRWQQVARPRRGLDGLLDVIEQLQAMPLPASSLERDILPARVEGYRPTDLDELCAAGEVVWRGIDSLGTGDGRIALYLSDHMPKLAPAAQSLDDDPLADQIRELLEARGAMFFDDVARVVGGFRNELLDALWRLVWAGWVTNDTLAPLRSLGAGSTGGSRGQRDGSRRSRVSRRFRSRREAKLPGSEGRWSPLLRPGQSLASPTERQTTLATQLLQRYGIVTRETVASENIEGGFAGLYPVFKAMEESGRVRRGYFVAGLGAAQFALPGAEDRLREGRGRGSASDEEPTTFLLAATDPANPYGASIAWPERESTSNPPQRAAGARVILESGRLLGFLNRSGQNLTTFLADTTPEREEDIESLIVAL
ncbi:MAG: DEAD/DEAH box helicase, partial [Planctomycetales bacterium]|nr:DEAD/DEAH box helicase [Planctomycetales bacterium]